MVLYVNNDNEIKDVNTTSDDKLTSLVISDEDNPFANWSVAKICCYKVEVRDGIVIKLAPYVDTRIVEYIDRLSTQNMSVQAQIDYIAMMTDVEM